MQATPQARQAHRHWKAGQRADKSRRLDTAACEYEQAARLAPQDAMYWMCLASVRFQQDLMPQAQEAARRALALKPDDVVMARVLAKALAQQNRFDEAAAVLAQLPSTVPRDATLLMEHAEALLRAERWQESVTVYMQALQLDMRNPAAFQQMGVAFINLNQPRDAAVCFETAIATDKSGKVRLLALSQLVQQLKQAGDWPQLDAHVADLLATLDRSPDDIAAQVVPFSLLALPATPAQQLRASALQSQLYARSVTQPLPPAGPRRPGRLRIGYLSADLYNHATTHLVTELLELHDTQRFEVFLYCHSVTDGSAWQARVRAASEHFVDVNHLSDLEAAQRMREDGIDIAIDLKGHTKDTRIRILAHRPAPLQLTYLGFPGTSGATFIDYVLGDPVVTPLAHAAHYSECIAQMPHSYQPNDSRRALAAAPSRASLGLPEGAVVLCSFNQVFKITAEMADLWARILRDAPAAVLWQVIWNEQAAANLVRELQARGVAPERLYFSQRVDVNDNVARLQCADLMLDTWPCNAHTTASDALWAGVPVLTVPGETFASRVAASLVSACGLPQMVCADAHAYVERAVALANDLPSLRALQRHLVDQRRQLPLFDSRRYTRDFEALLLRMWERHEAGLAPQALPAAASLPD